MTTSSRSPKDIRLLTAENVGGIANEPMCPVENKAFGCARMRPKVGHERLNEGQHRGDNTDNSVGICCDGQRRPSTQFDKNDDESGHRQKPSDRHQDPMKLS